MSEYATPKLSGALDVDLAKGVEDEFKTKGIILFGMLPATSTIAFSDNICRMVIMAAPPKAANRSFGISGKQYITPQTSS